MNRTLLIRLALAAALATLPLQAAGQAALEVIALRHRTAEQVVPVLRPLLEPGATLTGQGNQLIVRASPANLADLKRALETLDRPLRRLQISVRFDDAAMAASEAVEASAQVGNRGARVGVRAQDGRQSTGERVDQRLQVLEGGRAYIMTGQATPMPEHQIIQTGFEAVPRLSGDTVLLEIAPRRETSNQQQYLATTVSARLGEWFEVGAMAQTASRADRGIAGVSRARGAESRRVWLKVEEIRP
jgi:type II secretory pathway component GspD/PulD (secretin)